MSRRIVQTLQRALRTSQSRSIQATVPRKAPFKAHYGPVSSVAVRTYATHNPRGVPISNEKYEEVTLTDDQKRRVSLHKQAQYSFLIL